VPRGLAREGAGTGWRLASDDLAMRFRIRVARVQSVERAVTATDEQAAIAKVESELQKPYGLLGSGTTVDMQIEVVGAEPAAGISSVDVGEGPVLLSVAAASKHLGVSRGTMYELINRGEIEHVRIGRRIWASPPVAFTSWSTGARSTTSVDGVIGAQGR
jgi:excisionase family DNA binding protein